MVLDCPWSARMTCEGTHQGACQALEHPDRVVTVGGGEGVSIRRDCNGDGGCHCLWQIQVHELMDRSTSLSTAQMGIFDEVLDSSPHIARDELLSV